MNVKDFGAKGDGAADDYNALQAAATAACQTAGATLLFPQGTYRIDRYRITGGRDGNGVENIRYVGCRGTTITGVRAKIDVKGDFRRTADHIESSNIISYKDSVIPFEMINSSGFRIIGFEISGNVEKMSRDPKVVEGASAGILTTNCQDYYIEDVNVHSFESDGLTLGANSESADERIHLANVTSTHNARQGLTVVQVRGGEVLHSTFRDNGGNGVYGSHSPGAGVAVEPVRAAPDENVSTGQITFSRCRFEDNFGPQFISGTPESVDSLTVQNSFIKSTRAENNRTAFMSVPRDGTVTGSTFEIAAGHSVALAVYTPQQYKYIDRLIYKKNQFRLGDNTGILSPLEPAPVELIDNTIRVESRTIDRTLMRLDNVKLVENNSFFEASSGYSGLHYTILYEKGNPVVRNNRYDTDRTAPGYFDVYYGADVVASGEFYPHPAYFKPHYVNPNGHSQ